MWYRNRGMLSREWQAVVDDIKDGDYRFANMGLMHDSRNFTSNATYYCGLLPHNAMPWGLTFRKYMSLHASGHDDPPRRFAEALVDGDAGDAALHERPTRYEPADVAIGIYTGVRFLRTRAVAVRDTFLARHPQNRVFFFVGESDPLALFDAVRVEGAGEDYFSAMQKQMYALKHMWQHAADAKWFYVIGCDTYVFIDYLLTTLDPYDADEPHILGCCPGEYNLFQVL